MSFEKVVSGLCLSLGAASFVLLASVAPPSIARAADAGPRDPQVLWDKLCKSCHGTDGKGVPAKAATLKIDPLLLDLGRPGTETLTRDEQKAIVLDGKDKMPAYKTKVKPDEIDALVELAGTIAAGARKKP